VDVAKKKAERIVPGVWFLAAVGAMALLDATVPGARLIFAPYRYAGGLLIAAGIAMGVWAVVLFRRAGTTVRLSKAPKALVDRGPFRVSRHPMYLGLTLALCGAAALLSSLSPWAIALAFFLLVARPAALADEALMEETLGEEYRDYARKVRRWL
jgi:protein-S-isoprenylcysteine O-methyltransferase Ste14